MQIISLSGTPGSYVLTSTNTPINDFSGYVQVVNNTGATVGVSVATTVPDNTNPGNTIDLGTYAATQLVNGDSLYVPIDPIQTTTLTVTITGNADASTPSIDVNGRVGRPKVTSDGTSLTTWAAARFVDQVLPIEALGLVVYAQVTASGTLPDSGTRVTGNMDPLPVTLGDTLYLSTTPDMVETVSVELIEQGLVVTVSDDGDWNNPLAVDTRVLSIGNSGDDSQKVMVTNGADGTIAVKVVEYDQLPPQNYTSIAAGCNEEFDIAATTAYLKIYKEKEVQEVPKPADAPSEEASAGDPFITLYDDPVVVIRHKPIGNIIGNNKKG